MKVMRHSAKHRDMYLYSKKVKQWLQVGCSLPYYERCNGELTYPRGTAFSYNDRVMGKRHDEYCQLLRELENNYVA